MRTARIALFAVLALAVTVPASAQQGRALDHSDYDIWNRIQNDVVSPNGEWLAYRLVPGDGDATLVVQSTESDRSLRIERGASPRFSADSRHLVAMVEPSQAEQDAAREEGLRGPRAPKSGLVIVDLGDLSTTEIERVQSFDMPEDASGWMAYLLEEELPGDDDEESRSSDDEEDDEGEDRPRLDDGSTLVVRSLSRGDEERFDYVVDYDFAADGSAMYFAASGDDGGADGVLRVLRNRAVTTIMSGEGRYVELAVSDDGDAAFLTDADDRDGEAPTFALYSTESGSIEHSVTSGSSAIPAGWAPSEHSSVSFSDSGDRVFFGTAPAPEPEFEDPVPEDERVEVDIWNWKDPLLQPMQLVQAQRERERTYRAMLDRESGDVVQLATVEMPDVSVGGDGDGSVAVGVSGLPYRQLISWDGRYSDLYAVDVATGDSRLVAEMVRGGGSLSPGEKYITRWDGFDLAWYAVDVETGEEINLTENLAFPVHDVLDDHPDALRPYGSAGWTEDDEFFLVYDEFDIWAVDPTGTNRNVTEGNGRSNGVRYRYLDTDPDEAAVPWDEDVYLTSFDVTTKEAGIVRERFDGRSAPEVLISGDARFGRVRVAESGDVVTFTRETFRDFPNIWVADEDFDGARQLTDANPQQDQYRWGSAEIVEWTSTDGVPLQGILYKPDGFDPTQQYPMMVYFYERNSDQLHRHVVPAPGSSSINYSLYVSKGYLLFVPDIPYKIGYPGESALDAVVPGVLELVESGFVDREKIGVQGHSWGGYQIAYMVTRTDLFAAAEAGAPVSNMVSAYGGIRWQTGMSRAFQYERTQSRIGGSLWEQPLRFIENSPIFTADKIETPILMMHNDEDGAVPWYQGIEFFVGLRRLGKPVWMLNYNGEAHGLRQRHNQVDWSIRMQQFFDHYLMDAPAPVWMDEGVPAILKGRTLGLELTNKRVISEEGEQGS